MESPLESYCGLGRYTTSIQKSFSASGRKLAISLVFGAQQTHGYLLDHYLIRALVNSANPSIDQVPGSPRLEAIAAGAKYLNCPVCRIK